MLKADIEIRLAKLAEVSADNARLEAWLERQAGEIVDLKMEVRSLEAEIERLREDLDDDGSKWIPRYLHEKALEENATLCALIAKLEEVDHGPA